MGYCSQCGSKHSEIDRFCGKCGAQLIYNPVQVAESGSKNKRQSSGTYVKHKNKIFIGVFLAIFSVILCILVTSGQQNQTSKRTEFRIEFTADGIEKFLKVVCRNVDGKASVTDPDTDSPGSMYGGCYVASIDVKLEGKVAEEVQMRFYNENDSDMVSWGEVIFYDHDSVSEFNCRKEFVLALERTLSGKTVADQYITDFYEMESTALAIDHLETQEIARYWLTDELLVIISCKHSFSFDWYLYYKIIKY